MTEILLLEPVSQSAVSDSSATDTADTPSSTRVGSGSGSVDGDGNGNDSAVDLSEDGTHAVILYPTGSLTVNYFDAVEVSYDSIWDEVNLSILCNINRDYDLWALAAFTSLDGRGIHTIDPILGKMDITGFPVDCYMQLADADDAQDLVSGASFTMVSTTGQAATYGISSTAMPNEASATASPGTGTSSVGGSITAASTGSGASVSATSAASSSSVSSSELTPGAKAGLAIGIILAVLAILAGVFFLFRKRRRQMGERIESDAGSATGRGMAAAAAAAAAAAEKGSEASDAKGLGAPKPGTATTNRNSEDWRRFFGNGSLKALSTAHTQSPSPLRQEG